MHKIVKSYADLKPILQQLDGWDWDRYPMLITIEKTLDDDVLDCFSIFWIWMKQMSGDFTKRGRPTGVDEMHDMMLHLFLGYTNPRPIGKDIVIKPQLKTLTWIDDTGKKCRRSKEVMTELLGKIDAWASEHSVFLVTQASSEYAIYKEANQ